MLHIIRLKEFEKDLKRCAKRGKNMEKFILITDLLKTGISTNKIQRSQTRR